MCTVYQSTMWIYTCTMILPQYFFDGALSLTWAVLKSSRWAAVDGAGEHRGQVAVIRISAGEHRALLSVDQIAGVRRVSGHHLWCQHGGRYPASLLNGALHVYQQHLLYCMKRRWLIMENEWTCSIYIHIFYIWIYKIFQIYFINKWLQIYKIYHIYKIYFTYWIYNI